MMEPLFVILFFIISIGISRLKFKINRKRRTKRYHQYLMSEDWQRKRQMVLRRDNWRCVHCGAPATQVHHRRYAKRNIGREPIDWLEAVCKSCHESRHR